MTTNNPALAELYTMLGLPSTEPIPMPEETIPVPEGLTPPGTPSVATSEPRPERSMMERIGQFIPPELRELGRSIGSTGIAQEFKEAPIETTLEFVGPGADVKVMKESSARVLPRLREGDITGGLADLGIAAASIPMMAIPGSLAWHSGPRKWTPEPEYPHGRPDLSKAGTGEGHFMRGWGFYSGEAKGTGQAYRDKFKKIIPRKARGTFKGTGEGFDKPTITLSDNTILDDKDFVPLLEKGLSDDYGLGPLKIHERNKAIKERAKNYINASKLVEEFDLSSEGISILLGKFPTAQDNPEFFNFMKRIADDPNPTISYAEAPLYKMDIPDEDISNLLDWEKTLDQQPPKVQEALLNVDPEIQRGIDTFQTLDGTYEPVWNELLDGEFPIWEIDEQGIKRLSSIHTGGSLYETLVKTDAHDALPAELPGSSWYKPDTFEKKHTSLWLKSLGIPGLKYLDQFSRKTDPRALGGVSAKEGATHNYVIWDQDVLNRTKILERSGEKLAAETEELVPIFPKPERMFPEGSRPKGGEYINTKTGESITDQNIKNASISITPEGKPSFMVNPTVVDVVGSTGKGKGIIRTNLFKKKAGWKWIDAPKEYADIPTLISVEHKGKHYYTIKADFPEGVNLSRYPNKPSEPKLRPTLTGSINLGDKTGTISVRGKEHPVYKLITSKKQGGSIVERNSYTHNMKVI
jgi:hypothetical protein